MLTDSVPEKLIPKERGNFQKILTLSLPSSKSTFSQRFEEKCISEVVRSGSIIIFHQGQSYERPSLHAVRCNIFGEAAGEI